MFCEGFADLFDGWIFWIDSESVEFGVGAAEAERSVFEVEIDHLDVGGSGTALGAGESVEEELVLATAHGGDVGETVVGMGEVCVGVRGLEATGEDVEDGDGVTGGKPTDEGEREGEGGGATVGRKY